MQNSTLQYTVQGGQFSAMPKSKLPENVQVRLGVEMRKRLDRMVEEHQLQGAATLCRQYIKAGLERDEEEIAKRKKRATEFH